MSNPNPTTTTTHSTGPVPNDDASRIKALVDAGASTSEIAAEAYRLCHINNHLRLDVQQARDDAHEAKQKQAVLEDALEELRGELPKTRKLLMRTWDLLEGRNAKIPEDLKEAYESLKTGDPEWQAREAIKKGKGADKGMGKAKEDEMVKFLKTVAEVKRKAPEEEALSGAAKKMRVEDDLEEGEIDESE